MKLFLTATSERGKPITKSGNEYIEIKLYDKDRKIYGKIIIADDIDNKIAVSTALVGHKTETKFIIR